LSIFSFNKPCYLTIQYILELFLTCYSNIQSCYSSLTLLGIELLSCIAGTSTGGLLGMAPTTTFPNLVNQTMPNMPNYSANISGAFPALLGMTPGITSSASGGAILPGAGASLGEVCREYLYGRCAKTDCKLSHPPQSLLMTLLAPTTSMGTLSQVPMAPSAAAMAAAQAIVAAKALQAHAAQLQAQARSAKDSSGILTSY
jgi:hypothetical protein